MTLQDVVALRPAQRRDRPDLGRLGAALVALHHALDPSRFMPVSSGTEAGYGDFLVQQLARDESLVSVAEKNGMVVAYVYASLEGEDYMSLRGPAGIIHDLIVDPDHRQQGIGRRLLEQAIAELTHRGAPRIILSAAARNMDAQRLFLALGFRPSLLEMTRDTNAGV